MRAEIAGTIPAIDGRVTNPEAFDILQVSFSGRFPMKFDWIERRVEIPWEIL